jgi:predicted short-subunit dehydrogenase-like oxidoreductase (DUF2520 family)
VLSNFERFGANAAWSGPASRGDFGTIASHLKALKKYPPEYGEAYAAVHRLGARVLARRPDVILAKLKPALKLPKGASRQLRHVAGISSK